MADLQPAVPQPKDPTYQKCSKCQIQLGADTDIVICRGCLEYLTVLLRIKETDFDLEAVIPTCNEALVH
jgi:hypothetical protein